MELRHRPDLRKVLATIYIVVFAIYLIIGLQPAEATSYTIDAQLMIPSIDLVSDVTALTLDKNKLNTPEDIVGSYNRNNNKTLLVGHSGAVFKNLNQVRAGDIIIYNDNEYIIYGREILKKEDVSMSLLLAPADIDTLAIMTCAGDMLPNQDATHRLIVMAKVKD
ncbi:sortase [Candidatus Saccharibacteria bacterium]|nr:sortase [Candidatus Saccharibacteria bacterium]